MPEDDIALLTQNLQLRKRSTRDTHDFEKGRAVCLAAVGVRKSGLNGEWLVRSLLKRSLLFVFEIWIAESRTSRGAVCFRQCS